MSGDDSEEATPVPIPNTEVKFFSADGNEGLPLVRAGRCRATENIEWISSMFFLFYSEIAIFFFGFILS